MLSERNARNGDLPSPTTSRAPAVTARSRRHCERRRPRSSARISPTTATRTSVGDRTPPCHWPSKLFGDPFAYRADAFDHGFHILVLQPRVHRKAYRAISDQLGVWKISFPESEA